MDNPQDQVTLKYDLVPDAIAALLTKKCRQCGAMLELHAVGAVHTRSARSWTSSSTMALELYCPRPGGIYQMTLPLVELRMRIVMKVFSLTLKSQLELDVEAKRKAEQG